jgi:hypothetical protein
MNMVRKATTLMLVLGIGHVTSIVPHDPVAQADVQPSAATPEQFVVRDTFDDNLMSTIWRVVADDPSQCMMKEVNQRLELQATGQAANVSAGYLSGGARLDPRFDFSMRVDFHYDLMSYAGGWVGLGVTPEMSDPWEHNAAIGVGCTDGYPHYWHRKQAGFSVTSSSSERSRTNGTLYISYEAEADELYLGLSNYGPDDAWSVLPGVVKGEWGGRPVLLWLAGGSDELAVPTGAVYLDSLVVETGVIIEASLKEVHRFWSPTLERHFYTISEAEKEMLIANYKHVWSYEGVVYHAFLTAIDPDLRPVYRFWSDRLSGHFYTLNAAEKDWLIAQYSHIWTFEGVAFYAYASDKHPAGTRPVYRFWSPTKSAHFYTVNEAERNNILANYAHVWSDEGIAWYANE